jgi:polyhydroxyalkanoate synthase
VHLLEWLPPSQESACCGLVEYAEDAIAEGVAVIRETTGVSRPFLMGHSLGGALAAIFAALHSEQLSGLVLLSTPLCLAPGTNSFRDALVAILPAWLPDTEILPGAVLSQLSAMASPRTFVWSRLVDAVASAGDPRAWAVRGQVERWALDEVRLSGRLVREIFRELYQENRLCDGTLVIRGRAVHPSGVRVPALAVANALDEIAPPASVKPFLEAIPDADTRLITYPGEAGVVLQHLALLLGRVALAQIWPEIAAWTHARA